MTTWTFTFRELSRRPYWTLLTLCGVAVGVAVLVGSLSSIGAARGAYRELFECAGGKEALEVVAQGRAGFDSGFAAALEAIPGVRAVRPRIVASVALADTSGAAPALVFGLDVGAEEFSGSPFGCAEGVWLDSRTAAARGWVPGMALPLWTPSGPVTISLKGTVAPHGQAATAGVAVLYMPLATAQRIFALPGQVNSVEVILTDGADPVQVERVVSARLPAGLILQPPGRRGALSRSTLLVVEHGLSALALVALVAAGFVVLNTVLLNLTERRGQFALLRALGATERQVRHLLLREAAVLGLAGAALGTGTGMVLSLGLTHALQGFLGVALPRPNLSLWAAIVALIASVGLSLIAALAAARRAGRRPPLQDLLSARGTNGDESPGRGRSIRLALLGVAAILDTGLCLGWWRGAPGAALLAPGVACLLVGCSLSFPLVLTPILGACGRLLRRLQGIEGRLAECQVLRRPMRTGLTAGVLFLASASAVGFGHWMVNSLHDLRQWYGRAVVADCLVRGSMPDSCFLLTTALPEALAEQLGELPGVGRVDKISFVPAEVNGEPALVLARTFAEDQPLALDLRAGAPADVRSGLQRGDTVLGGSLALRLGVGVGDEVQLQARQGPVPLRVVGIVTEYAAGGDALYLEWRRADSLLCLPGVDAFLVSALPESRQAFVQPLRDFCGQQHLVFQSNEDLRGLIDDLLARVTGSLWALVALTFAVAALGVVNTLAMNVLEQARELGVLRSLGMTSRQARAVVLLQALLIGLASLVPGAAAGIGLAALINRTTNVVFGQQIHFVVNLRLTCGCLAAGLAITALAALAPAAQAARLSARSSRSDDFFKCPF